MVSFIISFFVTYSFLKCYLYVPMYFMRKTKWKICKVLGDVLQVWSAYKSRSSSSSFNHLYRGHCRFLALFLPSFYHQPFLFTLHLILQFLFLLFVCTTLCMFKVWIIMLLTCYCISLVVCHLSESFVSNNVMLVCEMFDVFISSGSQQLHSG